VWFRDALSLEAHTLHILYTQDHTVAVLDMKSPKDIVLRRVLKGHRAAVNVVEFDEKYIVSGSGDRTIKVCSGGGERKEASWCHWSFIKGRAHMQAYLTCLYGTSGFTNLGLDWNISFMTNKVNWFMKLNIEWLSSAIAIECGITIKKCDRMMFIFYLDLPHILWLHTPEGFSRLLWSKVCMSTALTWRSSLWTQWCHRNTWRMISIYNCHIYYLHIRTHSTCIYMYTGMVHFYQWACPHTAWPPTSNRMSTVQSKPCDQWIHQQHHQVSRGLFLSTYRHTCLVSEALHTSYVCGYFYCLKCTWVRASSCK